jgi:DNA repair protein RadC
MDVNPPPPPTAVREMPEQERPRERLENVGPEALRDAELLAVLFRTGTREEGAVALAGRVKAIEVKAALELGRRALAYARPSRPKIRSSNDVSELLMSKFLACETEHFKALLLNTKHEVLKVVDVSAGSIDSTSAAPLDVFRQAVRESAPNVVVAHNHPSGDPEPSRADIDLTRRLKEAGALLGISLLDHVIFGDKRFVSLKDRGLV